MMKITQHYGSLGEFLAAAARPGLSNAATASRRKGSSEEGFSGTRNFEQAVDLVQKGWPEGRDKILSAVASAQTSMTFTPALTMDVAGAYPIAALAAAGDPCSMVDLAPIEDRVRPVVRLVVQRGASSAYEASEFTNYGAAVLSYIEGLEAAGFRCEITVAFCSEYRHGTPGKQVTTFVAKRAEESMEFDRMAFVLTHPAMFRRICFAVFESTPTLCGWLDGNGYGYSCNPLPEDFDHDQILVPGVNAVKPGSEHLKTVKACLKHIGPMIERQLRQAGVEPPAQAFGGASK
jgi:hypothetical protein